MGVEGGDKKKKKDTEDGIEIFSKATMYMYKHLTTN